MTAGVKVVLEEVNQALFTWLNATEQSPGWLISFAKFAARDLIFIVPALGAVLWLWGSASSIRSQREVLLKSGTAIAIALVISWMMGKGYYHPRPFMTGTAHQFIYHVPDTSWPSDHGTVIFTFALAFWRWHQRWSGSVLLVTGLAIAWSRIYLGVHWPFDMLGAFSVGVLSCALTGMLWHRTGGPLLTGSIALYRRLFAIPVRKGWVRK